MSKPFDKIRNCFRCALQKKITLWWVGLGEGNSICRIWGDDSLTYCLTVAGFKWSHWNSQLSTYPLFSRDSRPLIQRLSAMGVVQRSWDPVSQSRRSKGRNAQPLTPSLSPPAIRYNGMPTIPASAKCFNATDIMSITLTVSTEILSWHSQPWSICDKRKTEEASVGRS